MTTVPAPPASTSHRRAARDVARLGLLGVGFAIAITLRVAIGSPEPARSPIAGLAFALALAALVAADGGLRTRVSSRAVLVGCAGAAALVLPAAVRHVVAGGGPTPGGSYAGWAVVVAVVATAEEAFLRGAFHDRVDAAAGPAAAVLAGAVAFAALHLPLYGAGSVPLDFAVALWLGWLRVVAGTWLAPAVAHVGADLAGWWLR